MALQPKQYPRSLLPTHAHIAHIRIHVHTRCFHQHQHICALRAHPPPVIYRRPSSPRPCRHSSRCSVPFTAAARAAACPAAAFLAAAYLVATVSPQLASQPRLYRSSRHSLPCSPSSCRSLPRRHRQRRGLPRSRSLRHSVPRRHSSRRVRLMPSRLVSQRASPPKLAPHLAV